MLHTFCREFILVLLRVLHWWSNEPAAQTVERVILHDALQHATLVQLAPNQTYHFRIVARDAADHLTVSPNFIFTTLPGELYLFQPSADTFVERAVG